MALRYLPLILYFLLIVFSSILYVVGPIRYINFDISLLLSFMIPLIFLNTLGFVMGVKGKIYQEDRSSSFLFLKKLFMPLVYISLFIFFYNWIGLFSSKSPSDFLNFGINYSETYDGYIRGSNPIGFTSIVTILQDFLLTLAVLFVISASFENKSFYLKMVFFFVVFSYVAIPVFTNGKMKYIGDIAIFYFAAYIIALAQKKVFFNFKLALKTFLFLTLIFLF